MPTYRLYQLNDDGHVDRATLVLILENDDAAVSRRAKQMLDGHDIEVWQRDRSVTVIKSPGHRGSEAANALKSAENKARPAS